jgi:hypothetical protein
MTPTKTRPSLRRPLKPQPTLSVIVTITNPFVKTSNPYTIIIHIVSVFARKKNRKNFLGKISPLEFFGTVFACRLSPPMGGFFVFPLLGGDTPKNAGWYINNKQTLFNKYHLNQSCKRYNFLLLFLKQNQKPM